MGSSMLAALRRVGDGLDRSRVPRYSALLLAIELAFTLFLVAGTHGDIVPLAKPATTDFVSFYAAGRLADAGTPELVYNRAAHYAAEERATAPGIDYNFFYYPPVYVLLCALIARLPYLAAFYLFEGATLALYLFVTIAILGERRWTVLLPLIAFPAVWWNFGFGQNAFLSAALFGAGTLMLERRPVVAGLLFGALCYKPQFGLLLPVALIAGGYWRAFAAAAAASLGLILLSVVLLGPATWDAYLAIGLAAHHSYECCIEKGKFVSPFGAVLAMGGRPAIAYAVQAAASLAAAALVAAVWRRTPRFELRAAMLAAATLVAFPVVIYYDLLLGAVAAAWLYRAAGGFSPLERLGLAALYIASFDPAPFGTRLGVPLPCLIALAVIGLVAQRIWGPARSRQAADAPA